MRSWTSETKSFGSVMIIAQDLSFSPVALSFRSSQARESDRLAIGAREIPGLFAGGGILPFVISRRRDETAAPPKCIPEEMTARRVARRSRTPNEDADDEDKHATDDDLKGGLQ